MPSPDSAPSAASNGLQIANVVMNGLMTLLTTYLLFVSQKTHNNVESVQAVQQQAAETTQTVKNELDRKAEKDSWRAKEDAQTTAINLWSIWTYLDHVANESGLPKDKEKADQARKVYDNFIKQNPQ